MNVYMADCRVQTSKMSHLSKFNTKSKPSTRICLRITAAQQRPKSKNILCSKTFIAKSGKEQTVEQMCRKIADFSKTRQTSDRSSGILAFEFSQDDFEGNTFHFMELYESNVHLGRHNTTEEFKDFMVGIQNHLEQPPGMVLYEWNRGRIGIPRVQGGPKGEGGLDDATGASGAYGGARLAQTSNALGVVSAATEKDEENNERDTLWGIKLPWMQKSKK